MRAWLITRRTLLPRANRVRVREDAYGRPSPKNDNASTGCSADQHGVTEGDSQTLVKGYAGRETDQEAVVSMRPTS
jgi:hypothetical protein